LVETLDSNGDTDARAAARALLETTLDLHGLALARIMSICHGCKDCDVLMSRLVDDEYIAAVLLLHGLHPEDAEVRLRSKIASMRPHWGVRGFRVDVINVDRTSARVRVSRSNDNDFQDVEALRPELEEALTEAAPDLDEIVIEWPGDFSALTHITKQKALANSLDIGADQHERPSA
jgi:hypothetical protein